MKRARDRLGALGEPRARHDEVVARQQVHAAVADGRHRRSAAQTPCSPRRCRRREQPVGAHFEDDVGRARQQRLVDGCTDSRSTSANTFAPPAISSMSCRKPTPPLA